MGTAYGKARRRVAADKGLMNMLKKSDYFYELPEELIAQTPAEPRDSSRLLVYDRKTGKTEHRIFRDIKEYLKPGDVLVINNTKVLPARMFAYTKNGGKVEVLLLKRRDLTEWEVLVKPGKKAKVGTELIVSEELSLTVKDRTAPPPRPPRGCILRRNCSPRSRRWVSRSRRFCSMWGWGLSAPSKKRI